MKLRSRRWPLTRLVREICAGEYRSSTQSSNIVAGMTPSKTRWKQSSPCVVMKLVKERPSPLSTNSAAADLTAHIGCASPARSTQRTAGLVIETSIPATPDQPGRASKAHRFGIAKAWRNRYDLTTATS